jgi:hypothetical protein
MTSRLLGRAPYLSSRRAPHQPPRRAFMSRISRKRARKPAQRVTEKAVERAPKARSRRQYVVVAERLLAKPLEDSPETYIVNTTTDSMCADTRSEAEEIGNEFSQRGWPRVTIFAPTTAFIVKPPDLPDFTTRIQPIACLGDESGPPENKEQ